MIIHVSRIPEEGRTFEGTEPGEILGMGPLDEFHAAGPVSYDLYAQVIDGLLIVRGKLSVPLEAHCARCTQIFSTTAGDSGFLRDYSAAQGSEEVDITEDIREALMLNLPRFPLCKEECKGLCPRCGKDLNQGICDCAGAGESGAWDALNKLNL